MFTYSDDSAYNDREIDMELSHWNFAFGPTDVEDYAVSPYNTGQLLRFPLPEDTTNSTHSMIWQSNSVAFETLNGNFASQPAVSNVLQTFTSTTGIPPAGGEQIHINLWLNKGNVPVNGHPVEVVLSQFEFVPLGPRQPAQLLLVSPLPGGGAQLTIQGQTDWHYDILSSSNLVNWSTLATVLATNSLFSFTDTNLIAGAAQFYRVQTDP
jgi:hypothetical protein